MVNFMIANIKHEAQFCILWNHIHDISHSLRYFQSGFFQFYMVAANLRGKYATEWLDILEMCLKLNDDKLAMTCFVKGKS